jgi:hypothetical protein
MTSQAAGFQPPMNDNEELQAQQREVERLLGRCLLRLQQYEHLMKAIVAHHDLSGPADALNTIRAARIDDASTKTLGTLVGQLFGSCVVTEDADNAADATANEPQHVIFLAMRMRLILSAEDYVRTQSDLKELVLLRNSLVHGRWGSRHPRRSSVGGSRQGDPGLFFQPIEFHLQAPDLAVEAVRGILFRHRLRPAFALKERAGLLEDRLLPLAHLHRMDPVGLTDLVDGLDAVNGLEPDFRLEFCVVCVPLPLLAHLVGVPIRRLDHSLNRCPDIAFHRPA